MKKYCPDCKTESFNNSKFCEDCGALLVSTPFSIPLQSGKVLRNRYRIESKIHNGGGTSIYKVWDLQMKDYCAVKEILPSSEREEEELLSLSCFMHEASTFSGIQHPNILRFVDYFSEGGMYYLAMDFIEGEDLEKKLDNEGSPGLQVEEVKHVALLILDALIYLHSQNPTVLYRDLNPSKIMRRNSDGELFLLDFGIAKSIRSSLRETVVGSDGYSPPEQYKGKPEPRSDLYALGATMYHLLSGFTSHFRTEYKPIPGISPKLNDLLEKALQSERQDRFASAAEMKEALKKIDSPASSNTSTTLESSKKTAPMPEEESTGPAVHKTIRTPGKESGKEGSSTEKRDAQSKKDDGKKSLIFSLVAMGLFLGFVFFALLIYVAIDHERLFKILFPVPISSPSPIPSPSIDYCVITRPSPVPPSPSPTPSFNLFDAHPFSQPSPSQTSQEEEVKRVLYDSFDALEKFDIDGCVDHYADKLDKYYADRYCNRYTVYRDKKWAMEKCKTIRISPSNFYFEKISDIECVLYFDKEYFQENIDSSMENFEGKVRARFLFRKQYGEWKIASEEDITIY